MGRFSAPMLIARLAAAIGRGGLLAFICGAALPLAYAPFDWYPFALLCPALFFHLILGRPRRAAALRGYLFGLGMFGAGTSWVIVSIHEYGHTPLPLAGFMTLLFVAIMALYPALLAWIWSGWAPRLRRGMWIAALPVLWVSLEWLRGWLFTGFPWLNLGYSQTDTPLAGYAPWLGVYGVSYLTALSAALLLALWRWRGRRPLWSSAWMAVAVGVPAIWLGGVLAGLPEWSRPDGAPLKVALLQGNISQHQKWQPAYRRQTMVMYRDLSRQHWDKDLIVWPEAAVPAFYHAVEDAYLAPLAAEAKRTRTALVLGIPYKEGEGDAALHYNSVAALGRGAGLYHKRHLVPFGEYVPLQTILRPIGGMFNLPMSDFASGDGGDRLLDLGEHKAAPSVCYEAAFGEELRDGLERAGLLINVSNDAWFGDSLAPAQHLQMARMRALESARPLLRATNTGITAILAHDGRIVSALAQFQRGALSGELQPRRGLTPYAQLGNWPVLGFMLFIILVIGRAGRAGPAAQRSQQGRETPVAVKHSSEE